MAQLVNIQTRVPEEIPDNQVDQVLAAGTHSLAKGETIPLKAPDGSYASVPSENINYALSQGYKVFTPTQAAIDTAVKDNDNALGSLKVFGSQFIDQAALGIPELVYEKTGDPFAVAKYEAIKKDHEAANILGNTLGFGAGLFTGAPLFKGASKMGEMTAAQVAGRLGAQYGEQVGSRTIAETAKNIAANLAGKTVGGAAEGALLFAPHAVTEAALGDPDQAAEVLASGLGVGALFGAGGYAAKGLLNLGSKALEKAATAIGETPLTAQKVARVGAETLTGVKGDALEKYVANPERINAAPTLESTKDILDTQISKMADELEKAKYAVDQAKNEATNAYGFAKQDLRKQVAPEDLRNEILTDMDLQKGKLGDLSDQADQILGASNQKFDKKQVLSIVDDLQSSLGAGKNKALIGEEATGAFNKLEGLKSKISEGLENEIDAPTMRDVLRQIRKDINYNTGAGEFNDTLNKLRKTFTGKVSDLLKDNPEYASHMTSMGAVASNLEKMSKHFSNPQRADATLNGILSPKGRIPNQLLNEFGTLNGKNYFDKLEGFRNAKALLDESAVKEIPEKLVPGHNERYLQAKQAYEDLLEKNGDLVRRFNPNKTQSIITRQGYKNASIEDRKALEKLSGVTGTDFNQLIDDRHVLDSFAKTTPQGSRKAVALGALGAAIGGPVGAAIGAAAGAGLDIYSGQLLKKLVDSAPNVSGLLFVEQQMKKAAEKLDSIPSLLDGLARKTPASARGIGLDVANQILSRKEKDKYQERLGGKHVSIEKLRNEMSAMVSNPAAFQQVMSRYSMPVTQGGAPQIGAVFNQKMGTAFNYIFNELPKPPNPTSPFAPHVTFKPSDQQVSNFMQKLEVVEDPFSVLTNLKMGTLTKNHMEALKTVYPRLHQTIQQRVQQHVIDGKAKPIPYQSRLKLSLLMEAPMDTSMNNQSVARYQLSYRMPDQTIDKSQPKPVNLNVAQGMSTDVQRLEAKTS